MPSDVDRFRNLVASRNRGEGVQVTMREAARWLALWEAAKTKQTKCAEHIPHCWCLDCERFDAAIKALESDPNTPASSP